MNRFRKMQTALVRVFLIVTAAMLLSATTSIIYAADTIPYTFSPGETISSAKVNANFEALSAQIAALQAQLAPVSIVGTYDCIMLGIGWKSEPDNMTSDNYIVKRGTYKGAFVFTDEGTVTATGTGSTAKMRINNRVSPINYDDPNNPTDPRSLIAGFFSTDPSPVSGAISYTRSGSTVTIPGLGFEGTLTADGKILVGMWELNNVIAGTLTAIRRQ